MVKDSNVPINEERRSRVLEAMSKADSLADITREATVYRVIKYLIEDKVSLQKYLTDIARSFTNERRQISYRQIIMAIFHRNHPGALSSYDKEFLSIVTDVISKEREIQKRIFIAENHLQVNVQSDLWKMYSQRGDALQLDALDFSLIHCLSLRHELKYYLRYTYESTGKIVVACFYSQVMVLNALTEVNPQIKYFADVTEADVKSMLLFFENIYKKKNGNKLTQGTIASAAGRTKRVFDYLMGTMRHCEIKAPYPHINPFSNFFFHNTIEYSIPTLVIPEDVIKQINNHLDELAPLYQLLYDIFINTGLRLKEVFFLEDDCIEDSHYDGICQLKFTPYKVLAAKRKRKTGDYHRIMITQLLADKISSHINDKVRISSSNGSSYIFLSPHPWYPDSIMDARSFINSIRNIIKKYNIRDENGVLWHFTTKQFRKTVAVTLIENGATAEELAYWLGHMCSGTAAKYYAEVRKIKLAELNTRFFKEKFDIILSAEQLEKYTEAERRLLYIDFRLEQRRVELGYCLIKTAGGSCPNRNSLYNCVNCKNLCTGQKYLPYWNELLMQQKDIVERLIESYHVGGIEYYTDYAEYKQELRLLKGYESIVEAINEQEAF
jgi:integrase